MDSLLWLNIKDPQLKQKYLQKRRKEITIISSIIFIARLALLIGSIITQVSEQRAFTLQAWVGKCVNIFLHFVFLLIGLKWTGFAEFHGPLLVLTFSLNFLQVYYGKITLSVVINNVIGFAFFIVSGLLTSGKWSYTFVAIMLTSSGTAVFYYEHVQLKEVLSLMQFFITPLLISYAIYNTEKK